MRDRLPKGLRGGLCVPAEPKGGDPGMSDAGAGRRVHSVSDTHQPVSASRRNDLLKRRQGVEKVSAPSESVLCLRNFAALSLSLSDTLSFPRMRPPRLGQQAADRHACPSLLSVIMSARTRSDDGGGGKLGKLGGGEPGLEPQLWSLSSSGLVNEVAENLR